MPSDNSPEAAQLPLDKLEAFFASEKGQELIARALGNTLPERIHPDRVYSRKQAARLMGMSPQTLAIWAMEGRGPEYIKLSANLTGYTGRAILAHRKAHTRRSTTEGA